MFAYYTDTYYTILTILRLKHTILMYVIPALAGGGVLTFATTPTFLELATRNFAYRILHQFDIDGANFVKIGKKRFEKITFCDVTTRHFGKKF